MRQREKIQIAAIDYLMGNLICNYNFYCKKNGLFPFFNGCFLGFLLFSSFISFHLFSAISGVVLKDENCGDRHKNFFDFEIFDHAK